MPQSVLASSLSTDCRSSHLKIASSPSIPAFGRILWRMHNSTLSLSSYCGQNAESSDKALKSPSPCLSMPLTIDISRGWPPEVFMMVWTCSSELAGVETSRVSILYASLSGVELTENRPSSGCGRICEVMTILLPISNPAFSSENNCKSSL